MSRIGKMPIKISDQLKVSVKGQEVQIAGPKGKLSIHLHPLIAIEHTPHSLEVLRKDETREAKALHGLSRTLVDNMVKGVTVGFSKELEINGVGYRAEVKGSELHMALGFSHPVVFPLPAGIGASVDAKKTRITLMGIDKQLLGNAAAQIRSFRPPEPYLGKGIRYSDEVVKRKEGKAAGK